jgi:threonine dehydrogenase-like Zn-dependent dehydrogenase
MQATKTLISAGTERICLLRLFEPGSHWDAWVKYPFSTGYSMVGRVLAVGCNVTQVREGERVAVRSPHQQYVVVPVDALYSVPDEVSDEDVAWFGLATIVQNGVRRAQHTLGEDVVVIGLGPLGQLVTQYVRLLGARQVIAVDPVEQRLEQAQAHGATTTIALSVDEARSRVLQLTDGAGANVVYDVTGAAAVFAPALRLLRRFGRLVLLGDTGSPSAQHLVGDVVTKGLTIIGAHDSNPPIGSTDHAYWSRKRMAELFFTYLQRGDIHVSHLITHRFSPHNAVAAYDLLSTAGASPLGILFDWTTL